jgi:hypothetical protein
MTGWSAAQALLATGRQGKPSIEEEKLIQYIHATRLPACNCWAELNSDDQRQAWTFVTGWVLTALASKHQAASEGELAFLLRQQNPDGSWTSIPAQGLIEYASVFATSWSIIGLHEQLTAGLITDEAVAKKMSDAIQRGAEWLAQKRQSNARWKAYPNLQSNSESDSLSGLAVHALHITRPDLIGEIYEDWLDNLPQSPVPASLGENTYVEIKRVGTVQIDHFVQLKMPWMLIATVDAYGNGSIFQKVRALTWIERTLSHESIKNADTEPKNWWRAELLIALNYVLQHAQAGHGRQASLSTRRSRSATA